MADVCALDGEHSAELGRPGQHRLLAELVDAAVDWAQQAVPAARNDRVLAQARGLELRCADEAQLPARDRRGNRITTPPCADKCTNRLKGNE
jgi:hypothetical protein